MKSMKTLLVAVGMVASGIGLSGTLGAAPASAHMLDPEDSQDPLEIAKRLQCGLSADDTAVDHWPGNIQGARTGHG